MHTLTLMRTGVIAAVMAGYAVMKLRGTAQAREFKRESGVLKTVDMAAREVNLEIGRERTTQTFHWDDSTRFLNIDGGIQAADLKPGQWVCIQYPARGGAAAIIEVEPVFEEEDQHDGSRGGEQPGSKDWEI